MDPLLIVSGLGVFIVLVTLCSALASLYQNCGPNMAMIISGFGCATADSNFKVVTGGGGGVVLPMLQTRSFLSLEVITVDIKSETPMLTKNGLPVLIDTIAQVKVRGDLPSITKAAEAFLSKDENEIQKFAQEILLGHLRSTVGTLTLEEIIQNFDGIARDVQVNSLQELEKMGLTVISFTLKEIKDNCGYIESLGRTVAAEAKRYADLRIDLIQQEQAVIEKAAALQCKLPARFVVESAIDAANKVLATA